MQKKPIEKRSGCVAFAAKILGDKWTPLLLQFLYPTHKRFSVLQQELGINPRTLSARLDFLEKSGIVTRTVYAEVPIRVEYALTSMGQDLVPVLQKMADWGDKYHPPVSPDLE